MNLLDVITDINSIKVYLLNIITFSLTLTNLSSEIKVILLILTGVFTIVKTIDVILGWKKKDKK